MPINLNQVSIAGSVGYIGEQRSEDAFNFGMMCKAPPQKALVILGKIVLVLMCESWGDDAERMKKILICRKIISLGGTLRFESWINRNGNQRKNYKIRVRSMQYSFFGKNQKNEEIEKKIDKEVKEI